MTSAKGLGQSIGPVAAAGLLMLALLSGCGGGGGGGGDGGTGASEGVDLGRQTVSVAVELPAGDASASTVTVLNSLGKATRSGSGAVNLPAYGEGQLTIVQSPQGNPMLLGWPNASRPAVDARSTAEVLVFFALGAFMLPPDAQAQVLEDLAGREELGALEAAIAASLEADPESLSSENPAVQAALEALVQAFAVSAQQNQAGKLAVAWGPVTTARQAGRLLVDPSGSRSGLTLNTTAGINSIFFANAYRRLSHAFVDRVSTFDANGNETPAPAALTDFEIPAVQGLSNATGTAVDIIWGRMAFAEITTNPLTLPAVDGAEKTRYRVCVVGPGGMAGDLSQLTSAELSEQERITQVFVTRDLFLPMVLNLLVPNSSLDEVMAFIGGGDVVSDFIALIGQSVPGIWDKASEGDFKGALGDAYYALAGSSTFRNVLCQKIVDCIQNNAGFEVAQKAAANAQTLLGALKVVDTLLQSFDTMGVGYAIGQSNMADVWTVDVTKPEVVLSPETSTLRNGEGAAFQVTVPEASGSGVNLVYHWTNSATVGHLADGLPGHRDSFDSTQASGTYTANDTGTGTDTIRVDVYMLSGDSQHDRTLIGFATATVDVEESRTYVLAGNASGTGSFNVDDDLDVYRNGTMIYSDGNRLSGYRGPISFEASRGDSIRLVVRDTYGMCSSMNAVYLVKGSTSQQLTVGFDLGCGRAGGDLGITFDQTFTVAF